MKPGNIILTKSGAKLVDFGLAKLYTLTPKTEGVSTLQTEQREITNEGTVLGTFQYMAPEQVEGRESDARTDIFAFGAVLYEMATGQKAFQGKSQASLIAAILKEEPKPVSEIQPLTPPILERLIKTCLEKDPDDRWQNAHDVSNQLRWISESSGTQVSKSAAPGTAHHVRLKPYWIWITAAISLIAGILGTWIFTTRFVAKSPEAIETHFSVEVPENFRGAFNMSDPDFAISPDGKQIIYQLRGMSGKDELFLRNFAGDTSQPVIGTEGATLPFWSPDGNQIAFAVGSRLMKVPIAGGSSQTICDLKTEFRGGVWLPDGTILFAISDSPILRVSALGGEPKLVTQLNKSANELGHTWPFVLPDYKHFIFLSNRQDPNERALYLGSFDSNKVTEIMKSPYMCRYIEPGYLIFVRSDSLFAQRLELYPPRLSGEAIRIANKVFGNLLRNVSPFSSSFNGVLAYRTYGDFYKTQLTWYSRDGKQLETLGPISPDVSVSLSPDQKRAVVSTVSEIGRSVGRAEIPVNIWIVDLIRGVRTRITFDPAVSNENAIWSPDGHYLVYAGHPNAGNAYVYQMNSSGEGKAQPILQGISNEHPIDWSPNGKFLLLHSTVPGSLTTDLVTLSLSDHKIIPFHVTNNSEEGQGQFSPDGRWVAFTSGESGRLEVYVKSFPAGQEKWQISTNGGAEPRWRGDGKELFYIAPDGMMMAVTVSPSPEDFQISAPLRLFDTRLPVSDLNHYGGAARYDVTADGNKFLINTVVIPQQPPILNVITNWRPPLN